MKRTLRKVVIYVGLAFLVLGIMLVVYGVAVNHVAMAAFVSLLNERGFKGFVLGVMLIVASVALLAMSIVLGKESDGDKSE